TLSTPYGVDHYAPSFPTRRSSDLSFGHSLGDEVLRTIAQRLQAEVGPRGRIGRLGGDEFALLLTDGQSRQAVEELGHKLIRAVRSEEHTTELQSREKLVCRRLLEK